MRMENKNTKSKSSQNESLSASDFSKTDYKLNSISKYDILLVYKNEEDFVFYKDVLQNIFNFYTAQNLSEVQNILNSFNNINLIIIDNPDFLNILKFIKENQVYYEVPTVLIEDFEANNSLSIAIDNGAYDIWHKPMNKELLFYRASNIAKRTSVIDVKTGLFSQDAFLARAEKILKNNSSKTYYIIHYDIDNFKIYNHTYGVKDGDELLRFIGQESLSLATNDSIFCRWEKDHFVALVEERYLSSKNVIKFFMNLEQKFHPEYRLLIRMGLFKIENRKLSIIQMCDRALLAHESSKDGTQIRYAFYDERLLKNRVEEQEITDEMETALENGEFVIFLQPQYNQTNMHLYGAEALVRWNHPKRGLISPSYFIPIFERNGFILKLDRYIFRQVCELQRKWLDNGFKIVPISVNLSRAEAQNDNLYKELLAILDEYHLEAKYINLEITESAYMDNPYQVISLTKKLQEAGFELEMDDFGSGYSSLNTLKDIPVNVLKLDFKFLYGEDDSDRITKILSSIIRMAHGMNMPIIAEGVETKEQADYLKSLGCFYIQGFYFDKPLPTGEFENRLMDIQKDYLKNSRFVQDNSFSNNIDFSTLLNDFVGPAIIIEYDGTHVEAIRFNDAFFSFFSITNIKFDISKVIIEDAFDSENFELFKTSINQSIETKEEVECELQLLPDADARRPSWIRIKIRFLFNNEHICTLHIKIENIEEEKRKDEILKKLSDDLYALSESLPGGMIVLNYKDNNVTIEHANEQMANMIGYSLAEYIVAIKQDIFSFVYKDDKQKVQDSVMSLLTQGHNNFLEMNYRLLHKDNSIINARFFCKVKERPDGTKYAAVIVLNFTDQEELQAKITTNQRVKQIDNYNLGNLDDLLFKNDSFGFDFAQNSLRFGIFKYNYFQDKIVQMSPSVHNLFGYTREEFYIKFNDSLLKMIWKEDLETFKRSLDYKRDFNFEDVFVTHRVQTKSGKLKWVKGFGKKIHLENGEEACFGIVIDIDHQKQIEEKLIAQDFLISSFENNLEGATVRYKIKGKKWSVDYISDNNSALFGYSKEELSRIWETNLFALIHPEDVEMVKQDFDSSITNQQVDSHILRLFRADDSIMWVKTRSKFYGKPNDGYFVITCYNITKQIEKENQLLTEKQRLQNLIDALPGGIVLYEIRHDNLKVLYVSEKVSTMFGRSKEQFIQAVEDNEDLSIFNKDAEKVQKAIKNLEKTGEPFNIDFRVKHLQDQSLVWANVSAVKTSENNGNPVFLAIYQNKTKTTQTLDRILSKTSFLVVVFDTVTKELLYANAKAQEHQNKVFDPFNPIDVSEFIFNEHKADFDNPIPKEFTEDSYKTVNNNKSLLVKRFRVDWNGHDAIFVLAEEIIN